MFFFYIIIVYFKLGSYRIFFYEQREVIKFLLGPISKFKLYQGYVYWYNASYFHVHLNVVIFQPRELQNGSRVWRA